MSKSVDVMAVKDARAVEELIEELIKVANRAKSRLSYINAHGATRAGSKIDADLVIDLQLAIARVQVKSL